MRTGVRFGTKGPKLYPWGDADCHGPSVLTVEITHNGLVSRDSHLFLSATLKMLILMSISRLEEKTKVLGRKAIDGTCRRNGGQ